LTGKVKIPHVTPNYESSKEVVRGAQRDKDGCIKQILSNEKEEDY
jgi:hypothetical protein